MSRQLHSKHFEICRICQRKPETDRTINFLDIYKPLRDGKTLKEYLKDFLNITAEPNDQKPRVLCEVCYIEIDKIKDTRKKQPQSRIFIDNEYSKKPTSETRSDERRYCLCDDVMHGTMVACDNKKCPNEWYHYGCVGVRKKPLGKWYCPLCISLLEY